MAEQAIWDAIQEQILALQQMQDVQRNELERRIEIAFEHIDRLEKRLQEREQKN